jgi:N-acetylglutamate synthase-like GNAT family acetyltransferase
MFELASYMKQIFVRAVRETDVKKMFSWATSNPAWDSRILSYRNSLVLAAFNDLGTVAFLPVQQPLMLEAAVFHPLATDCQKALAMKELTHTLIAESSMKGWGEIFFLGSDERTNTFAEHQGFKKVDLPLYRLRLMDLETAGGNGNGSAVR